MLVVTLTFEEKKSEVRYVRDRDWNYIFESLTEVREYLYQDATHFSAQQHRGESLHRICTSLQFFFSLYT